MEKLIILVGSISGGEKALLLELMEILLIW